MYTEGAWDQTNTPRLTRATTPPPELHPHHHIHPNPHHHLTPLDADSVWSSAKLAANFIFLLTEEAIKQGPSNSSVLIALFNLREHKWSSPLEYPHLCGCPPPSLCSTTLLSLVKGNRNECAHLALSEDLVFFLLSLGSLQNKVIFSLTVRVGTLMTRAEVFTNAIKAQVAFCLIRACFFVQRLCVRFAPLQHLQFTVVPLCCHLQQHGQPLSTHKGKVTVSHPTYEHSCHTLGRVRRMNY